MAKVLIVGAGFAGAVLAREIAEAGHSVEVIDTRPHIGGNCFDSVDETGVRIHRYGPHLFHTSNQRVVDWLSRFTEWLAYEHRVVARLPDGRLVPMPVNLDTVNALFGLSLSTPEEVAAQLAAVSVPRDPVVNAEDHLFSTIGPELTNLFFRPYTKKMWDMDLTEIDAAVVRRLQIRTTREAGYFTNDTFQAMPKDGYTAIFERILDHHAITVRLGTPFTHAMLNDYDHCFNSMAIDEFFGFAHGELPYRSIRFHTSSVPTAKASPHVTINYTDAGPYTRETWWHNIPGHQEASGPRVLRTVEEPCDYHDNNHERYYPVKTHDGRFDQLYRQYEAEASKLPHVTFIGRCGTYQYLDMHQVINQSLLSAGRWIAAQPA